MLSSLSFLIFIDIRCGTLSRLTNASRTVLIAGAGYVSRPVGDILVRHGVKVIYGCRTLKSAQRLAEQVGAGASAIALDVYEKNQLNEAIKGVDLIVRWLMFMSTTRCWADSVAALSLHRIVGHISLRCDFPNLFCSDPQVIEAAVAQKVSVLTTSYISPQMQSAHDKCQEAGIVVLNELGEL